MVLVPLCIGFLAACADRLTPLEPSADLRTTVDIAGGLLRDSVFNRYIVVLRKDVPSAAAASEALIARYGGVRFHVYNVALKGFAVANLPAGAVEALARNPLVAYVEEDRELPLASVQSFVFPADTGLYLLDRIDQRYLPLDWQYQYAWDGTGVHIYIIDTGIYGGHVEFGGYARLGQGVACISFSWNPNPYNDPQGHGTAVAAAAAGSRVGVAKGATIHSVRVDDGDPDPRLGDILCGMDWVAANRQVPAVANLSIGHGSSQAMADAAQGMINRRVTLVTAAGNYAGNACDPTTQVPYVVTVAATTNNDSRAGYSSFGPCVDVFAPGGDVGGYHNGYGKVEVARNSSTPPLYRYTTGTSFASPVVAGVAALVLQQRPSLRPHNLERIISDSATSGVVVNAGAGSPNRLLYSRITFTDPPPPPFSVTIVGPTSVPPNATCTWDAQVSGGTYPYTYEWRKDGILVGEGPQYTEYGISGSFTLRVSVFDAADGFTEHQISVVEDPWAAACPL